jgi:hypothetical protein
MNMKRWVALGAFFIVAAIAHLITRGSGEEDIGRVRLAGSVSIKGVPLEAGRIQFTPDVNTKGPVASAAIKNGRFDVPREEGPVPGTYSVVVELGRAPSKQEQLNAFKTLPRPAKGKRITPSQSARFRWPGPVTIGIAESKNGLAFDLP